LALHELATNAFKYGALSVAGGQVLVRWHIQDAPGGAKLEFSWQEKGGPVVTPPSRRGFGSRIIERVLAADFAGEARLEYRPDGLHCGLTCPLAG
jgi:two-component sensor histidine kinase